MRPTKPGWMLCAIIAACIGIIGTARAQDVLFTWSDGPFTGGGEITGSFIINDNFPTQTGFLGDNALVSFQAHWTGNLYSQPYDWSLAEILSDYSQITWIPPGGFNGSPTNVFLSMQLDPGTGPVEYEPEGIIEDYRPGAIDPPGFQIPQYEELGTFSGTIEVLPEPGITQMLLGLALPVLLLRRWRRFLGKTKCKRVVSPRSWQPAQ